MARVSKKKEVAAVEKPVKKPVKKVAVKKEKTAKSKEKVEVVKTAKTIKGEQTPSEKLNAYLIIDYPIENDILQANGHYAIRIGASHDGYVEVSFNGGEWVPARFSDGYWWFDWVYFSAGDYTLAARMIGQDGKTVAETPSRKYTVC
ncbi:MAG: hypothetical protein LBO62_04535 [Endomicrobium sp.]|jgi:hypothetical protein|nr:hypothetical protein [Endomicrobium sp.]